MSGNNNNFRIGTDGNDFILAGNTDDIIFGRAGNDTIGGYDGDDIISGEAGDDLIDGDGYSSTGNDIIRGGSGNDNLYGSFGNDFLIGGDGNDRVNGVSTFFRNPTTSISRGAGQVDTLVGGAGADTFVLWSVNGGGDPLGGYGPSSRFNGNNDYALITDFNKSQDVIELEDTDFSFQLKTVTVEYSLGASPEGLPQGTGIYVNNLGEAPDLIAIFRGVSPESISLSEPYFKFI